MLHTNLRIFPDRFVLNSRRCVNFFKTAVSIDKIHIEDMEQFTFHRSTLKKAALCSQGLTSIKKHNDRILESGKK